MGEALWAIHVVEDVVIRVVEGSARSALLKPTMLGLVQSISFEADVKTILKMKQSLFLDPQPILPLCHCDSGAPSK